MFKDLDENDTQCVLVKDLYPCQKKMMWGKIVETSPRMSGWHSREKAKETACFTLYSVCVVCKCIWEWGCLGGRAADSWSKGPGFESRQERRENVLSRVNFLCRLLPRCPFHHRATAAARKRSRHGHSAKCRWQVTAKHMYILRMWLQRTRHYKLVQGCVVYTELAPRRQQCHVAPALWFLWT